MELVQLKFQRISEILEGPKSLQEWREKPQKGVQYRLLFLFLLITLITVSVFQALFVGIFKLRNSFGDDPPPTSVELVYTYTLFSFLIGSIIGNILSGITADRIGRRKTLLFSLLISIPYAFVYTMVLWIVSAMNFSTWSGLVMVSFGLILGLLNNQIPIVLASAFDLSSFLAQATTVVLILLIGATFAPAVVKELLAFGILFAADHEWFFPIYGIIMSVILIIPFTLTYLYIPETLGKEVPPHPLEATYTSVFTEESEKDSLSASPIANSAQLLPPISDVDHGWLYPLFVLRDVRTWILFWITFSFYGAFTATNYLSLLAITEYDDSLETPLKSFGVVFIVERVVVSVIGLGVIFAISAQFPQYIMQVGYLLLLRISLSVILFVTLFCVFFTLVLSFAVETWLYWVALAVYPTLLDVSFVASLFYLIAIICLASNVGFRNESGFLFAFISAALIGGILVFVTSYFALSTWLEFMNFYRYPLIFFFISVSICFSTLLAFTKLDSELNEPRSELRIEKNEKIDRLIYMFSPLIYFLFIVGVTVLFFITSLF